MATARSPRRAVGRTPSRLLLLVLLITSAGLYSVAFVAHAPPPIPMLTTQGVATDRSGAPLPVGTPIRTFIDGVDYSNHSTVESGSGSFSVLTAGNYVINSTTPEASPTKNGANAGETVLYTASDFTSSADVFQETVAWYPDVTVTKSLHLGSAATTPEPLKIQGIVTQPAQGGVPYVFLCNPTPAPISLSDYYLQRDAPGTYYGANLSLGGAVGAASVVRQNLTSAFGIIPTGDALKLVYHNPGGAGASAGGRDIVADRVEFNATLGGSLDWQPGATIMGSAPAPGPGQLLERSPTCADTNSPSDFHLAVEPGLPAPLPITVTIVTPSSGQNVQSGQVVTIRWTMMDNVFVNPYLRVWVNVTYLGTTFALLAGSTGATSVDWAIPGVDAPGASLTIQVVDPFGSTGNATSTFNLTPATPYSAYVAILIVVVVAVFILWAYRHARKEAPPPQTPPTAPETPPKPPVAAPSETKAAEPPTAGVKVCPQCHTSVNAADATCFYCGHAFVRPP